MNNYLEITNKTDNYKVLCIQTGQPRRYADSEYIYKVTDLNDEPRSSDEVLTFCRRSLRNYPDKKSFLSPYLTLFVMLSPGIWKYHVTEPYCD